MKSYLEGPQGSLLVASRTFTCKSNKNRFKSGLYSDQGCGPAFISPGSGSSILGWILIRIQCGSRALMTKNWKKIQLKKKNFGSKTTIYLSLGLHKERPRYRRSLQLSKETIQHFKTWTLKKKYYFCGSFLPSWIRIRIPNPDPLIRLNPDAIRIRIQIRIRNPGSYTSRHN